MFIDEEQLAWFEATLQRCGSRPVVVFTHVRTAASTPDHPKHLLAYTCHLALPAPQAAHVPCLPSAGTTYGLWSTGCAGGVALCCPSLPVCALAMVMSATYAQPRKRICSPGAGLHVAHWGPRRCMSKTAAHGSTTAATPQHSSAWWSAFPTSASGSPGCVCCDEPPCLRTHVLRFLKAAQAHAGVRNCL